jgi:hypothetical protein
MILRSSTFMLLLALLAGGSLQGNPGFGPPRELTEPILRPASLAQSNASVASDGERVAIVWSHHDRHVLVARFEKNGAPIDYPPLRVASVQYHVYQGIETAIVWTGETYLIAWIESHTTLRTRPLSPTGELGPISTIASGAYLGKPRIAISERQVLVGIHDRGPESVILGSILDPAGNVLSPARSLASLKGGFGFGLAAHAKGFLVLGSRVDWGGTPGYNGYPSSVHAVPVSFDGAPGAERLVAEARSSVFNLQAASNGSSVVAMWSSTLGAPGSILTAHIDPDGTASPPVEVEQGLLNNQTLTFTGQGYVATVGDGTGVWSLRLDERGEAAGPLTLLTPDGLPPLRSSSAEAIDGSIMVALEPTAGLLDIFGMILDTNGVPSSSAPFWLARSSSLQRSPAAASADGTSLVAWVEERTDQRRHVVAVAVVGDGGETLQTRALGETDWNSAPAVASNGREYAVVWFAPDATFRATLISSSGEIIEERKIEFLRGGRIVGLDLVPFGKGYVAGFLHQGAYPYLTSLSALPLDGQLNATENALTSIDRDFRGNVISLSNRGDRVLALYGGAPLKYGFLSANGGVEAHATSVRAMSLDHEGAMAVWTDGDDVLWGSVSTSGVTPISSVPRRREGSMGLPFATGVTIARLGGGYVLAWEEGLVTEDRTLYSLELDAAGHAASEVVPLEWDLFDVGAPELVGTATGARLLFEGVDPASGAPEVTRIYLSEIERIRPERRRAVRRAAGAEE